ncbi:hypothetical protein HAX54_051158 [Datura stramonium]|uniref:Uncharacterized protein n=1 Tax=Datura stramonium TaxID=4076 RepID=A0ABS8SXX0_DATST|nr:hypothetical protein [Datura stramonium]
MTAGNSRCLCPLAWRSILTVSSLFPLLAFGIGIISLRLNLDSLTLHNTRGIRQAFHLLSPRAAVGVMLSSSKMSKISDVKLPICVLQGH